MWAASGLVKWKLSHQYGGVTASGSSILWINTVISSSVLLSNVKPGRQKSRKSSGMSISPQLFPALHFISNSRLSRLGSSITHRACTSCGAKLSLLRALTYTLTTILRTETVRVEADSSSLGPTRSLPRTEPAFHYISVDTG